MDQQFSLSWNNFHGNLSKGFAGLLGNGEFVDVTIAVEGHLLQAHKVILSICSPYFKKMFQMNPCQHPIIVIRDVSHKSMRDLLQFMYHGEVSVKREDLTNFIGTAEVLQIKGLTNQGFNQEADEDHESEQELPKRSVDNQIVTPEPEMCSDPYNSSINDTAQKNDLDMLKQKHFIEKLQRISNLKRRSEEYNSYFTQLMHEKRVKVIEKQHKTSQKTNYEHSKSVYDENPLEITSSYNSHLPRANSFHDSNDSKESPPDDSVELKTECDDSDIIVTDPLAVTPLKGYDTRDGKKDLPLPTPLEYPSPQDSTACLSSLFVDLKNLVNGKGTLPRTEEYPRHPVDCLVTIPQKEDGKKKYPQRSCRLCWKIGRRRDTRFMCSACEQPFCKAPCFGIHYNDAHKVPINYAT